MVKDKKSASNLMSNNKAQGATVSFIIGIVVLVIVVAVVAIPVVDDITSPTLNSSGAVIENATVTGTDATILTTVGTLLAVLIIVMIANAMG